MLHLYLLKWLLRAELALRDTFSQPPPPPCAITTVIPSTCKQGWANGQVSWAAQDLPLRAGFCIAGTQLLLLPWPTEPKPEWPWPWGGGRRAWYTGRGAIQSPASPLLLLPVGADKHCGYLPSYTGRRSQWWLRCCR